MKAKINEILGYRLSLIYEQAEYFLEIYWLKLPQINI